METVLPPNLEILPLELADQVRNELELSERVIWIGQPIPEREAQKARGSKYFAIAFLGIIFLWTLGMCWKVILGIEEFNLSNTWFAICSLPLWIGGIWLFYRPEIMKRNASHTVYALTNQRAIVWKPDFSNRLAIRSYRENDLKKISRIQYDDGSGDLVFEDVSREDTPSEQSEERCGFLSLANVKTVEALVRKTLLEKSEPPVRIE